MSRSLLACVLLASAALSAAGQTCPKSTTGSPSQVRELEGQVLYHDGLRQWFELKLDKPQCGQTSIQIAATQGPTPIETLRDCRVSSRGYLDYAHTGYFSREMYQDAQAIEPIGKCERKPPFPDYSNAKPSKSVRAYRVDMIINYRPGDHPVTFRVTSAGKPLQPWQAYASYYLTGGFALRGHCSQGFVVDKVFGTPEARPGHFDPDSPDDVASFEPEYAAEAGKWDLQLTYTCVRNP